MPEYAERDGAEPQLFLADGMGIGVPTLQTLYGVERAACQRALDARKLNVALMHFFLFCRDGGDRDEVLVASVEQREHVVGSGHHLQMTAVEWPSGEDNIPLAIGVLLEGKRVA